ncbi:MAG: hypothetical protein B6240_04650 [Desulfobacteraceae bacterium 4572_87]|nr:MAG: hypothetical protein B6240_04650 [Desulfobacteraceae bacterium 4572_87]
MTNTTRFERYFKAFRDIIRSMQGNLSLQEVLDIVVEKSTKVLDAKGALLRIFNKETQLFEVRAAHGLGKRYLSKGPVTTEKILSDKSELHKVQIITDIWNAPRVEYPQETWDEGIRMMLDVPLAIQDEMVGFLRIYLRRQREFPKDELDFIVTVTEQCACIIERVRLMENQREHFTKLATHMEKLSSLGRMAAGIAHEINNPLGGILLFSSNMSKKVSAGDPLEKGLKIIVRETQRCKTIIQGLLEFSRDEKPQKNPFNINDIIETALSVVENEFYLRHVTTEKELAQDMVETLLDKNQIEQVFINLLLNALHAVEEYGRVTVHSAVDPEQKKIRIEISDNGCGISAENVEKIFEPFYTTRGNGTGLGLSVSYGIIKNHEGDVHIYSELGKGSRFTIEFPILTDKPGGKGTHNETA